MIMTLPPSSTIVRRIVRRNYPNSSSSAHLAPYSGAQVLKRNTHTYYQHSIDQTVTVVNLTIVRREHRDREKERGRKREYHGQQRIVKATRC
jgi:hypothetical protein